VQEDRDLHLAAKAFSIVNQCRRLPALLENFLGASSYDFGSIVVLIFTDDVRNNFFLIEEEINEYMARFDVRFSSFVANGV
jgi:hypothetical protein